LSRSLTPIDSDGEWSSCAGQISSLWRATATLHVVAGQLEQVLVGAHAIRVPQRTHRPSSRHGPSSGT
jgi:hypothetical protein